MDLLINKGIKLVTAESCTGGLLANTLTHKPGSSQVFDRGFITYSNESKMDLLGVTKEMIEQDGAVSSRTAEAMALGALKNSSAGLAVSVTGIAGPSGGTPEKPVGLVFFGYALKGGSSGSVQYNFQGSRHEIQAQAAATAIKHLLGVLGKEK